MDRPGIGTPEGIQELANLFRKSRALLSAFELDLFTALGQESLSAEELAAAVGADARGVDRLLNACAGLGLVRKDEDLFSNTPESLRYLSAKSPDYLSGLAHTNNVYASWNTLTEAVRKGGRVTPRPSGSEANTRAFIEAMHRRARGDAGRLAVVLDLACARRVLDVGGGSGVYSMAMCRANPDLSAVVLDLPHVTPLTRAYVAAEGFEGRITTLDGDYLEADFGGGFDLVFLSAVVHINSAAENRQLVRKAAAALNPGGRVAVVDFVMDEHRAGPLFGALFALNMLVNTERGDTYTEAEIRSWMEAAGLSDFRRLPSGPHTSLVTGRLI